MRWKPAKRIESDAARVYRSGVMESVRLHISIVSREWLALLGAVLAILALVLALLNEQVSALTLFLIAVVCLFIAQFISFHREREKGAEISGALYLLEVQWGGSPPDASGVVQVLQPTLVFRNTSNRQIRYELLDYTLRVNDVTDNEEFSNRFGWVGAGQDSSFRLPQVKDIPNKNGYTAELSYRFRYESPRIKHYEHRTARKIKAVIVFVAPPPAGGTNYLVFQAPMIQSTWAFVGEEWQDEEETIRR
jgi:hypothetical protein